MRRFRFVHRGPDRPAPEELEVQVDGSRWLFSGSGATQSATAAVLDDGRLSLLFEDGRQVCGRAAAHGEVVEVVTRGSRRKIALAEPLRDRIAHARDGAAGEPSEEEIRALMPGRVVEVAVSEGQSVAAGALILVLEAMKMQNEIRSARAGVVVRIDVEPGKAVEGGSLLAVLRPEEAGSQLAS
jgi:biotin carboxyl carrier protein